MNVARTAGFAILALAPFVRGDFVITLAVL